MSKRCIFLAILTTQAVFLAIVTYRSIRVHSRLTANRRAPVLLDRLADLSREGTGKSFSGEASLGSKPRTGEAKSELPEADGLRKLVVNKTSMPATVDTKGRTEYGSGPLYGIVAFQQIDNEKAWLYSAYYDHVSAEVGKPLVRIMGVVKNTSLLAVFCHFKMENGTVSSSGYFTDLPDHQNKIFHPVFVNCDLTAKHEARPREVAVTFKPTAAPTNRLQVQYPGVLVRNFTVCYSILHSKFKRAAQLLQSIEMNRILGAEHFFVYNHSVSPEVDHILQHYQRSRLLTVLPWPIPTLQSWYFGQMTAINDCIYRNRNVSRYVAVLDTDELIIPRKHDTWLEIIQNSTRSDTQAVYSSKAVSSSIKHGGSSCCFIFQSSFFNVQNSTLIKWNSLPAEYTFTETEKKNVLKYKFLTLAHFWRVNKIFRFNIRSKYITSPEVVEVGGIHFIHKLTNSSKCLNIGNDIALVHHYRKPKHELETVYDTSILRFKKKLYARLIKSLDILQTGIL